MAVARGLARRSYAGPLFDVTTFFSHLFCRQRADPMAWTKGDKEGYPLRQVHHITQESAPASMKLQLIVTSYRHNVSLTYCDELPYTGLKR